MSSTKYYLNSQDTLIAITYWRSEINLIEDPSLMSQSIKALYGDRRRLDSLLVCFGYRLCSDHGVAHLFGYVAHAAGAMRDENGTVFAT